MNQTFQNSAQVLSIGIFFTLMIIGLSATLPHTMSAGLQAHGVPAATAHHVAQLPPVSILFAAFLGYNPIQHLRRQPTCWPNSRPTSMRCVVGPLVLPPAHLGARSATGCTRRSRSRSSPAWSRRRRRGSAAATGAPAGELAPPGPARRARTRGEQHAETTVAR